MIRLDYVYYLFGTLLTVIGWISWRDRGNARRHTTGAFWTLLGISVVCGEWIPLLYMGLMVLAMILLASFGGVGRGSHGVVSEAMRQDNATRFGHQLFLPALLIPTVTMLGIYSG